MKPPIVIVPIVGTGIEESVEVIYWARFLRGPDGTCAYCHGDPGAKRSGPESAIARFLARAADWAHCCPVCDGQAT